MNERCKTVDIYRSCRNLRPLCCCGKGAEKKWLSTVCPCVRKSNSLSRRRHPEVHIGSTCGCVTILALEDDGGGSIVRGDGAVGCDGTPSVRGPPSPGLRARTMDVAQDLMALRGSSHAYNFDCRLCFGRLIGDHDDRFEGFCWSKTLWRHRKG